MRRQFKGRSDAMVRSSEGEQGFWPSYADMMSAVALILFFLMLLSYISNMITGSNLKNTEAQLSETRIQLALREQELDSLEDSLALTKKQVETAQEELNQMNQDLEQVRVTLSEKESDLAAQDELLQSQKTQLSDQQALLADQEAKLRSQQALIGEKEEYLAAANEEILELRGQMETIVGVRKNVLEQIRDSVVEVMGDASKVKIGDNGSIILNEGVFFDVGSAVIKEGAKPMLDQLSDVFQRFLEDADNIRYVDSIVISGHADITGSRENNRQLSSARANAVLGYLLDKNGKLQQYASCFCAAGYGDTRPVATNDTEEGRAQNRRIEISIILKDETIMDIVKDYLELDLPAAVQADAAGNGTQAGS